MDPAPPLTKGEDLPFVVGRDRIGPMTQHDHPTEDDRSLVGVPDGFDRLWTPHRMAYVTGERPSDEAGDG